jgi:hypothetical protein
LAIADKGDVEPGYSETVDGDTLIDVTRITFLLTVVGTRA